MSMTNIATAAALCAGPATSSPQHAADWHSGTTRTALGFSTAMPFVAPQQAVARERVATDAKQDRPPRGVGS